ncbi:hypothetical protein [Pseudomonas sp. A-B-26]|uniref:hypothetical protein n=1 Tax=Pseudomonas sp. A-B-26 TaxID=2832406 RepID=UPI001CBD34FA|nr:hypothetical protein [Pseudomonas sp. A-B-26]
MGHWAFVYPWDISVQGLKVYRVEMVQHADTKPSVNPPGRFTTYNGSRNDLILYCNIDKLTGASDLESVPSILKFINRTGNKQALLDDMEQYMIHEVDLYSGSNEIYTIYSAEGLSRPSKQPPSEIMLLPDWRECRQEVVAGWFYADDVYMSPAAFERFKQQGQATLPRNPRVQTFRVFSFFDSDNYLACDIAVDIDNYTADDMAKLLLSHYKGKVDLGIYSDAGAPDGKKRYYRSIRRMVYTNFSTTNYIIEKLKGGGGVGADFRNRLYVAVSTGYTVAKVPSNQIVPLEGDARLISDYNISPDSPIVATWSIDPAPRWNIDWGDIAIDTLTDLVADSLS